MKLQKKYFMVIIIVSLLGLSFSPVFGQVIRFSHEMSPDPYGPEQAFMVTVKYYLETMTDMEPRIFPNNVLGGIEEVIEQLQEGDIQMAQVSLGGLSHFYDKALILSLDYAYPRGDERVVAELWDKDNPFTSAIFEEIEEKVGVKPLGMMRRGGWSVISNSVRPIKNLEDVKGITLRAMDSRQINLYESLGAIGLVVPWTEIYTALQTGVADGQRNPVSIFLDASLNEVQDYVTFPGLAPGNGMVVADLNWYNNLTQMEQSVLDLALHCAFTTCYGLSYLSVTQEIERLERAGIEVYYQTEEEYAEFRKAGLEGQKQWAIDRWGESFVNDFFLEIERIEDGLNN